MFEGKSSDIGILGGPLMPGTVDIWTDEWDIHPDTDMGLLLKGYADFYVVPKFAFGLYAQYVSVTMNYGEYSAGATMYEFGFSLKARLTVTPQVAFKPGFNMGYRRCERESVMPNDNTKAQGLAIDASLELQYYPSEKYALSLECGFITQPTGGNADANLTWGPIPYLAAGIVF
jgi:hypothetical protein